MPKPLKVENDTPAHRAIKRMIDQADGLDNLINLVICENADIYHSEEVEEAEIKLIHAGIAFSQVNKDRIATILTRLTKSLYHSFRHDELEFMLNNLNSSSAQISRKLKRDYSTVFKVHTLLKQKLSTTNDL